MGRLRATALGETLIQPCERGAWRLAEWAGWDLLPEEKDRWVGPKETSLPSDGSRLPVQLGRQRRHQDSINVNLGG